MKDASWIGLIMLLVNLVQTLIHEWARRRGASTGRDEIAQSVVTRLNGELKKLNESKLCGREDCPQRQEPEPSKEKP